MRRSLVAASRVWVAPSGGARLGRTKEPDEGAGERDWGWSSCRPRGRTTGGLTRHSSPCRSLRKEYPLCIPYVACQG